MYGVATFEDSSGVCAFKQKLKTYRAVLMHCSFYTFVVIPQFFMVTGTTCIAVEEVFFATYPTYTAFSAVKGAFSGIVIKKWTN